MAYIGNPLQTATFLTDTFNGDNSTVAYTLQVAPANTASILVAVDGVVQEPSTYGLNGTTLTFSEAPPTGTGNISIRYLGIPANVIDDTAYRTVTEFTATASQTTFTVPSYTVGYVNVYRNGLKLGTSDFTASSGTTVVLGSAANSGDLIVVEAFRIESINNAIPSVAGAVTTNYILDEAITPAKLDSDTDFTINGLTVGKGANAISSNTAFGLDALDSGSLSGGLNTAVGYEALKSVTTGASNTAVGYRSADALTTGINNVAIGQATARNLTTGSYNIALGQSALYSNTTTSNNTAVGYQALYTNTASNNTAVGYQALYTNTTGTNNASLGHKANFSGNTASNVTAVGYNAALNNTANSNTAIGSLSMDAVTSGNANTSVGVDSLGGLTTGTSNTSIGYASGSTLTTGFNNTLLGYNAQPSSATASNEITLGNASVTDFRIPGVGFYIDDGNVGIGTNSPLAILDVASSTTGCRIRNTTNSSAYILFQNSDSGTTNSDGLYVGLGVAEQGYMWNYENNVLLFGTNNAERMRIDNSGNVGIGNSNPKDSLDIFKGFRQRGTGGGIALYDSTLKSVNSGENTLLATVTADDLSVEFGRAIVDCQATVSGANAGYSVHRIVREILYSKYGGSMRIIKDTILSNNQGSVNSNVILTTLTSTITATGDTFTINATGTNTGTVGGTGVYLLLKLDIFGQGALTTIAMA